MLNTAKDPVGERIAFGPFELLPTERRLLHDGVPLQIGGRTMDVLLCLVEREGEIVNQRDLFARVWPGATVEPSNLRFQVGLLRKAFDKAEQGGRYILNVAGRGYCFVAPTQRQAAADSPQMVERTAARAPLPPFLRRMVGRDHVVADLLRSFPGERIVTLAGAGGIGKTTVAMAVAHSLSDDFPGEVHFVDLGRERDVAGVATAVATTLQLPGVRGDPTANITAQLQPRRLFLVLDSCEHVIDGVAALTESLYQAAPQVHILATSREPLRVEGERVYRLAPLEAPPPTRHPTLDDIRPYSAVQLFLDRVAASGARLAFEDGDATVIAEICHKLDGIALAIELAAVRVECYGLRETLALLDSRLRLSWQGRRTALARHQTLNATLDWSYALLSDPEKRLLRAMSIFVGAFVMEDAEALAGEVDGDAPPVALLLAGLVLKSLVVADPQSAEVKYRLLDTTRAYAAAKLAEAGEATVMARRHAEWVLDRLKRLLMAQAQGSPTAHSLVLTNALAEARSALNWSFSDADDLEFGVILAATGASAMLEACQYADCHRWAKRALGERTAIGLDPRVEMALQMCLGRSDMFLGANTADIHAALNRGLELAEQVGELEPQIRLLSALQLFHIRKDDAHRALGFAERVERVAEALGDAQSLAVAHSVLGACHHLMGAQVRAEHYCNAAVAKTAPNRGLNHMAFGFEHRNRAIAAQARVQWLRGRTRRAVETARQVLDEETRLGSPASLAVTISATLPIFMWIGDQPSVTDLLARLRIVTDEHSLGLYRLVCCAFEGADLIGRGQARAGVVRMWEAFEDLEAVGNGMIPALLVGYYVQGLMDAGDLEAAMAEIDDALDRATATGQQHNLAELLRLRGEVASRLGEPAGVSPIALLLQALAVARRQGALVWRVRAAMSLLRLRLEQGRPERAAHLLAALLERFPEPTDAPDLIAGVELLTRAGVDVALARAG